MPEMSKKAHNSYQNLRGEIIDYNFALVKIQYTKLYSAIYM
jgi:hypothetical protein